MTLTLDIGAASALITLFASISVPLTVWLIKGIVSDQRNSMYVKAVDFVKVATQFESLAVDVKEMQAQLITRFDSIDRKLDHRQTR